MPAVSNTFFCIPLHPLREERHFALVEKLAMPYQPGSLVISFRSAISIRPMHLFGHNRDHDYSFRLLREEERDAQSITRCSSRTPSRCPSCPAYEPNFVTCS